MIRGIKQKIDELTQKHIEDMESIYSIHPYWINRDSEGDEKKIIRRALIAQLFSLKDTELVNWPDSEEWKSIKTRITALFNILEKLGCFILRKGAVESYYKFEPNTTYNGKPSAAAAEVSHWEEKTNEDICEQYDDIIRSLRYAALEKDVDESFAVKKELLSELALVLGILDDISTEKEILSAIKQAKGNTKTLFDYKLISENDKRGVEISLKSRIMDVTGFPFKAFKGDNVNQIVDDNIHAI